MLRKLGCGLLVGVPLWGQVTAKITDTDGQAWIGGSYVVQLLSPNGAPTIGGIPQSVTPIRGALDSTGSLSAPLIASSSFDQSGVVYAFSISPNATYGAPIAFTVPVSSTTQNLTPLLPTNIYAPRFYPGQGAYGYSDAEASKGPYPAGSSYFNVSLQATRVWNGTAWTTAGGSGGGGTGTVTSVAGISPVNGNVPLTASNIGAIATGSSIPASSLTGTIAANQVPTLNQNTTGTASSITGNVPASQVSGLAPSATTDATNASNITSGTLPAARVPILNQNTTGSAATVTGNVPSSQITGLAPSATTDTTNAANISSGTISAARIPTLNQNTTGTAASITGSVTSAQVTGLAPSATTDTTNAANIASGVLGSLRLPLQYATLHFTAGNLTQTVTHNLGILYPNVAPFYYLSGGTGCYFSANTTTTFSITCPSATDLVVSYMGGTPNHVGSYIAPTITWPTPAAIASGTQLSSTQLNATTTAAGTFVYNPPSGTTINSQTTLNVTFTPTDTSTYTTSTGSVVQNVLLTGNYYIMNEGSGQTLNDSGSYANNISGSGITWNGTTATFTYIGGTTSTGVRQVNTQTYASNQALTVAGYFNIAGTQSAQRNFFATTPVAGGASGFELDIPGGSTNIEFAEFNNYQGSGYGLTDIVWSNVLTPGTRQHICIQKDGSATAAGVSLYINGTKQAQGTVNANSNPSYTASSYTMALMAAPNSATQYQNTNGGTVDHFHIAPTGTGCPAIYASGN